VQVAHQVCITKGVHKCGSVGKVRGELHGALRNLGHSGLCRRLQDTKLYKSGRWGREHVGFASLRPCASAAVLGIQGKSYTEL
jgi:hypothetical protein